MWPCDSPPIDNIGGIPGGNQRVAYLYDPLAASPTARNGLTDTSPTRVAWKVQQFASANQIGQGNPTSPPRANRCRWNGRPWATPTTRRHILTVNNHF
jgi:hypothetical protein